MILYLNAVKDNASRIELRLIKGNRVIAVKEFSARMQQSEKLLPGLRKLLQDNKVGIKQLKEIRTENSGGSFSALRIGIATANALGFALGIPVSGTSEVKAVVAKRLPFSTVEPIYNRPADITIGKRLLI